MGDETFGIITFTERFGDIGGGILLDPYSDWIFSIGFRIAKQPAIEILLDPYSDWIFSVTGINARIGALPGLRRYFIVGGVSRSGPPVPRPARRRIRGRSTAA